MSVTPDAVTDSFILFICPIAIAYSTGHYKTGLRPSVCQCVCPSVGTLTVAFLDRFSPKLTQTKNPQK